MTSKKSGFTIMETVLVLAIATLLFMSVTIGVGSRIANGRYQSAANSIADNLRDIYAETLNVENSREGVEGAREYCTLYGSISYSGDTGKKLVLDKDAQTQSLNSIDATNTYPGRTNCVIYGKIAFFGDKDGKIHIFDIVGDAVSAAKTTAADGTSEPSEIETLLDKSVLEQLDYVRADYLAIIPDNTSQDKLTSLSSSDCSLKPAANYTTYEPNFGALFKTANFKNSPGRTSSSDFVGFIMIVRAPASGDVMTYFYESSSDQKWDFTNLLDGSSSGCSVSGYDSRAMDTYYSPIKLYQNYLEEQAALPSEQRDENTGFCIGSDDFYIAISNNKKYVEVVGNGQNASAIKLDESTGNVCQK